MKRRIISALLFVFFIGTICSKDFTVSFFLKSSIGHPSFIVNGQNVEEGKTYSISDTEKIYVDFGESDFFEVNSVRIRCYYNGEYDKNQSFVRQLVKEGSSLPYFTIGNISGTQDISIEWIPEYKSLNLNLTTIIDGDISETGNWFINSTKVNSPYSVPVEEDFYVSYEFDASNFYLVGAEPTNKVLSDAEDSVIFMLEKYSNPNRNVEYTITLKPYTSISFNNSGNHIQDILYEGESILKDISKKKFRNDDEIIVVSDVNYSVDKTIGLDIIDIVYEDNCRKTTLRVPEDSTRYNYTISVVRQERTSLSIKLICDGIKEEGLNSVLKGLKLSLLNAGNDSIKLDDLINKGFIQIDIEENGFISMYLGEPTKNLKVSLKVKSNTTDRQESYDDIQADFYKNFSYKEIKDITEIEISITKGFRFIPTSIQNDYNIGDVSYYYNRKLITEPVFIPFGSIVTLEIKNAPEDRRIKNQNQVLERIDDNLITKSIQIDESTTMSCFEISATDIPSFIVNPKDYQFEHGTIDIQIKKGSGIYYSMEKETFVCEGDSIKIVPLQADEGFTFSSNDSPEKNDFYSKEAFDNWIRGYRFIKDEEAYITIESLPQPYFWTVIYKYEDGKEVQIGDNVKKQSNIICYYDSPKGFNNPDNGKVKEKPLTAEKLSSFVPKPYEELEDNKPNLTVELKNPKKINDEFAVDIKYAYSSDGNLEIGRLSKDQPKFRAIPPIKTSSPLIFEFRGFKLSGKALDIAVDITYNNKEKEPTKNYRTDTSSVFDGIKEHISNENGSCVSSIKVTIEMIDVSKLKLPDLENATIKVLHRDEERNEGYPIKSDDIITIKVVPDVGYYIEGTTLEDYSLEFNCKYSEIESKLKGIKVKSLVNVLLPDLSDIGITYKLKNNIKVEPGKQSFKVGEVLYLEIESGKERNFEIIDVWKYTGAYFDFNNFFNANANTNYSFVITENSDGKTLSIGDFNCKEKDKK